MQRNFKRNTRGITLIVLIITIIILIILAGIAISSLTGNNGLIVRAKEAREETKKAEAKEKVTIAVLGSYGTKGKVVLSNFKEEIQKEDGSVDGDTFPLTVAIDGYEFIVESDGTIKKYEEEVTEKATVWEGKVSDSFDISESGYFLVESDADLALLAKRVNEGETFKGIKFLQTADIDLGRCEWVPIGNSSDRIFEGTFEGAGWAIYNVSIVKNQNYSYVGLFGNVGKEASIKGMSVVDLEIYGDEYVGGIAGYNKGNVDLCAIRGSCSIIGKKMVGGIVGNNDGIIYGCENRLAYIKGKSEVGGIAGYSKTELINCSDEGIVEIE